MSFIIKVHAQWIHEYANEVDDDNDNDNDVPKPAQSLSTLVPKQKKILYKIY